MKINLGEPNDKQKIFLSDIKHKHIGFGGARAGGKSWAVQIKSTVLALKYPGIKVCIVRRTFPELTMNHIEPMLALYDKHGLRPNYVKFNTTKKKFTFVNGSMIKFLYCRNDEDLKQFQGTEWDVIFIDEATQLSAKQCQNIAVTLRAVNEYPKQIHYTCNPGGQSHTYFKRLFVDRRFEGKEKPEEYVFIQALVTDNKALMEKQPDYIDFLEALPPRLREMWLYGRWDVFEGMFFEEFRTEPDPQGCLDLGITVEQAKEEGRFTHVIEPLPLATIRNMKIYRSYDHGRLKPFSCGWWGVNSDGVIFRILEFYGCTGQPNEGLKWDADKVFKKIKEIEETHPFLKGKEIEGVADPSIWAKDTGISIYEMAVRNGVYFKKGDNKRIPGWMQCHYRLTFDDDGFPLMYVFNNCKHFIRTIPTLMCSESVPEDLDTELEDHIADEWRYFCMSRPVPPQKRREFRKPADDPLNMLSNNNSKINDWRNY